MGTVINLALEDSHDENLLELSFDLLKSWEKIFSANDSESELSQINAYSGIRAVRVHEDLFELISIGKKASLKSASDLNIGIGALVKTWNIGFQEARMPEKSEIERALSLIDVHDIIVNEEDKSVFLKKSGMKLDLGSLAKGYFADKLKDLWLKNGVKNGLIDLGRNIHTIGGSEGNQHQFWKIGIQDPFNEKNLLTAIEVRNKSIVTSGTYEKYFLHDGKRFHHILDSKTGYPVETDIASISIITDSSLNGEILSTTLLSFGRENAIEFLKKKKDTEAIIIDNNNNLFTTL